LTGVTVGYGKVQVRDFRTESLNSVLARPGPNFWDLVWTVPI